MSVNKKEVRVILPDIRSSYNVGAIFRTSDAVGVSKIYLTGITPRPFDKFKRINKEISKTALGAEKSIPWGYCDDPLLLVDSLKKEGFCVVAVEQAQNSVDYKTVSLSEKTVIIFGSEVGGLPPSLLERCDIVAEIPMLGEKESLNISVSFGVALFRFLGI